MKSGLYACAGRLGDGQCGRVGEAVRRPDHERVERVLHVEATAFRATGHALDHGNNALRPRAALRRLRCIVGDPEHDRALDADDVAHRGADQAEEVPLDPVARELARNGEHEGVAVGRELVDVTEPLAVRAVAERLFEPPRDLLPKVLCRQLDLVFHRRPDPPVSGPAASITGASTRTKLPFLQGVSGGPASLHRCGQAWGQLPPAASLRGLRLWTRRWTEGGYTDRRAPPPAGIFLAKTSLLQP